MDNSNKLEEVQAILSKKDTNDRFPERKIRYEKKEKGLYERTENSTILLTEDNKMMLND